MPRFHLENAFLADGWSQSVAVDVADDGTIRSVLPNSKFETDDAVLITGHTLPGIANLHSHAFQRAMAGLTERVTAGQDNFWTWRNTMYSFLQAMTPDHMEAVAAQLYVELLKHGYTSVAEFHYLHHNSDGNPYDNLSETSDRIVAASVNAGIGLCHLPVLYGFSGFGEAPPTQSQRRFINNPEGFLRIIEKLIHDHGTTPVFKLGMAAHSLRAVSPTTLNAVLDGFNRLLPNAPLHVHIAEQFKEVEDCVEWSGKRPVEYLYDQFDVNSRWCLIHATHLNDGEIGAITDSGAIVGICPTTEANLGDGIFPAIQFFDHGGQFGVGTDSHISVSLADELRLLEYSQRLQHRGRNLLTTTSQPSTGMNLFQCALRGGRAATGFNTLMEVGARADFVVLDQDHPAMIGRRGDEVVDSFIFANSGNPIRDVYVAGKQVVAGGRHFEEERILRTFAQAIKQLRS